MTAYEYKRDLNHNYLILTGDGQRGGRPNQNVRKKHGSGSASLFHPVCG